MIREINTRVPDQGVIALLEQLLEDARKGELQSFAVVLSYATYLTGNAWAGMGKNNMALVGELLALQHDLLNDGHVALRRQPVFYDD